MADSAHERPLSGVDELVAHFAQGSKPKSALKIGVEHEKVGVLAGGRAPDYDVIRQLLEAMAARGWNRVEEQGNLIALGRPTCGTITLEPGGQVEHSGAPWSTALQAVRDNDKHTDELLPLAAELGIRFLATGFRPFGLLEDVPWMPKGRYRVMRAYLPTRRLDGAPDDEEGARSRPTSTSRARTTRSRRSAPPTVSPRSSPRSSPPRPSPWDVPIGFKSYGPRSGWRPTPIAVGSSRSSSGPTSVSATTSSGRWTCRCSSSCATASTGPPTR